VDLISDLLSALADAHTPRAMVRAIATVLGSRMALKRVELRASTPIAIAELIGNEWRCIEGAPAAKAHVLVPGLAIVGRMPAIDDELRTALEQVIGSAVRHLEVVQRIAALSRRSHAETRALRAEIPLELVARSPAMRAVVARAALVSRHPTTVLIIGESGSGKEVLAREVHRGSPRAHRPMLQVNCGAIPDPLVESELFGHERGAFTGAERTHIGVFERAHRGTLFLDEVAELSPSAQVKLLRVLQERRVMRVGGTVPIEVDVRLICATNRSLDALREDLRYRLDVFSLHVPSLRERKGDLAPLVTTLVAELATKLELPQPKLTRTVLARLEAHDWPGNVRELRNVLEAALILGEGEALELPDALARKPQRDAPRFDSAVRATIEESLRLANGKIYGRGGAAERLGLKPGTLQSKMKKLGIERRDFAR
jgi:formate hydrogenlyase transcriptional activator